MHGLYMVEGEVVLEICEDIVDFEEDLEDETDFDNLRIISCPNY